MKDPRARGRADVLSRPARPPDLVLRYGEHPDQVADVHLPPRHQPEVADRSGEFLLIMFMHGGFWRAEYDRGHTAPLAEALAAAGFVVCAPEYRRSSARGSGWPGTFDDVAAAVDRLPGLVAEASGGLVDARAFVLAGHSAGGHLALWAAARHRLPADSAWRTGTPGPGQLAVVALAAVSELAECQRQRLGDRAADALMGGTPDRHGDRYALADPVGLLPAGVPVRLVHGTADDRVPHEMSVDYAARARLSGDDEVECVLLEGAGHFDVIDPLSVAWPAVLAAFRRMHPPVLRTAP